MSNNITNVLTELEQTRLDLLCSKDLAEEARDLLPQVYRYKRILKDLESKGWRVVEKSDGLKVWREEYI